MIYMSNYTKKGLCKMNKKLLAILVIALTLVCLLSFSVSAKDVYVKNGANGTGASATDPIGLISQATALLGDEGGTVYVIGRYAVLANYSVPELSGDITFKGIDGGSLALSANLYGTVNTNDNVITFDLPVSVETADDRYIIGRYNSITFGDNFAVTCISLLPKINSKHPTAELLNFHNPFCTLRLPICMLDTLFWRR